MSERAEDFVGTHDPRDEFNALLETIGNATDTSSVWTADQQGAIDFVGRAWRSHRGWRVPKSHAVWECALAAVLEQKVTGKESKHAWRGLANEFGEVAPGPAPTSLRVPPGPDAIRKVPSWRWRQLGVDRKRSDTVMRLAGHRDRLAGLPHQALPEAHRVLTAIPGVGEWTYAEIAQRALGDPDALSVGDYHLAAMVGFSVTGRRGGTDADMLETLAPFAGHRYRAVRMVELSGSKQPRRGPRMEIPGHRYG